jgi:hypothetical protein
MTDTQLLTSDARGIAELATGQVATEEPIVVSVRLDRSLIRVGVEETVHCVVEVDSRGELVFPDRPPMDLVIAVDRSGSMAEHLELVAILVRDLVDRLTPHDRVALVGFSEEAELVEPLSAVPGRVVEALETLRASGRSDLSAWWDVAIGVLAGAGKREATRSILLFSDLLPNVGEVPEPLREPVEKIGGWTFAGRHSFVASWNLQGSDTNPMPAFQHCVNQLQILPEVHPELVPLGGGHTVGVEYAVAEGIRVHDPDDRRGDPASANLGRVSDGKPGLVLRTLTIPAKELAGVVPIGEVVVRSASATGAENEAELRITLEVTAVDDECAVAREPDPDVIRIVAQAKYWEAKNSWDRVVVAGTRDHLHTVAGELRAMGEAAAPFAELLDRRVAELDAQERRYQGVIDWLDRARTGRLIVLGEASGPAGWVAIDELPPSRAEKRSEDGRRILMARVARLAANIEAVVSGAPADVYREGMLVEPLASVEDGLFAGVDWRLEPDSDHVPSPVPEPIVAWWEDHRGLVSVRCDVHGELARFDVSRTIGMLGAAWDAAVVEYHNRWETSWDGTYDTPEYEGCAVRIEPTDEPGGANLLDVKQMWIVTEGNVRPWWPYELVPGSVA